MILLEIYFTQKIKIMKLMYKENKFNKSNYV